MPYVNRRDGRDVETVDSFATHKEARAMAREYALGDPSAAYYVSARACKAWREEVREAARPVDYTPPRPVPAYLDSFAGLVPYLILSAHTGGGALRFRVRFTGRRARLPDSYRAGNVAELGGFRVVPRDAIRGRRSMSGARILPYAWADRLPGLAALRHMESGA